MKKRYKARWNRILCALLIPIVFIFIIYFGFIKDYEKEKLLKIGYNNIEITTIRNQLSSEEIKKLSDYSYLSYLTKLITTKDYHNEVLLSYIDYISKLNTSYDINDIVYLVNNGINYPYSEKLINIIHSEYFILSRLDRYMAYDSDDIRIIIESVNNDNDYEFYTNTKKADISKENLILVNKFHELDNYDESKLVTIDPIYSNNEGGRLNIDAYEAFKKLVEDADKEGYNIRNNYAYRSYDYQKSVYEDYEKNGGTSYADQYAARPGYSEHQTGLALDVGVATKYVVGKFGDSKESNWMKEHAHLYGFILRYPEGKENLTGYSYEPWHYRYVGIEAATYIYEHNITFEEYYAYFIDNE